MSSSILVEESTLLKLSPSLENFVKSLPEDSTQNDYLIALIIVIFKEAGLSPIKLKKRDDSEKIIDLKIFMNGGIYELSFEHNQYCELDCKLDAILVGDTMILNLTSVDQSVKTRCIAVDTLEYINLYSSDISSRYMNLKKFSHKCKDSLTTPLRHEILNELGVMNASLLGLPPEIRQKIRKMADGLP